MIVVFCPTRGRPDALKDASASLVSTRLLGDTQLMAVVDWDDPRLDDYLLDEAHYQWQVVRHEGGMVNALNAAVAEYLRDGDADILGFIGDDHRFRTKGWDYEIAQRLKKPGYAYGNDLFWPNGEIPTQIFISRKIVEALGYFALPDCTHLYVDNAWRAIAEPLGMLNYMPEIVVEHMHPSGGKGQMDEGYRRVNSPEMYGHDGAAFEAWLASPRYQEELARVRQVTGRS